MDPSGNSIIFIERGEPDELEHGGSKRLTGLAKALDNARILREFENDDLHAFRALKSAIRRHGADAPTVERAMVLCHLIDRAGADSDARPVVAAIPWARGRGTGMSGTDRFP
ncbi:hypothetical protein ACFVH6_05980 [Spirillospora sp. NPDC127200]